MYQLIESILTQFQKKIEKKGLKLTWKNTLDPNQIIHTDAEKLHLILSNLLANAIQFNSANGSIGIDSFLENELLVIKVRDTGIGISIEQQEKIYDRFYQVEEGSTKTYGGHGLGLCITKALLDILEGTVQLKSELGKGTEFTLTLPNLDANNSNEATFSSDGNDFLFENDDDDMLF
jgi:signal transduction histidine kinase